VHVAPLARGEWPVETIAALARRRRVSFDGQGLSAVFRRSDRCASTTTSTGRSSATSGCSSSRTKKRRCSATPRRSAYGRCSSRMVRRGSTIYYGGKTEHVPARAVGTDPTGAGDRLRDRVHRCAQRKLLADERRSARHRRRCFDVGSMNVLVATSRARSPSISRPTRSSPGTATSRPRPRPCSTCPRDCSRSSGLDGGGCRRREAAAPRLARHRLDLARMRAAGSRPVARSQSPATIPTCSSTRDGTCFYVSRNGGVFWSALALELPEIERLELRS